MTQKITARYRDLERQLAEAQSEEQAHFREILRDALLGPNPMQAAMQNPDMFADPRFVQAMELGMTEPQEDL